MKIFVVGTTGVLGRALVPLLEQKRFAVRALVRTPEKAKEIEQAGVEAVLGDLLEQETVKLLPEMMKGCTAVVHIATAIPRNASAMAVQDAWDMTARLRIEGTQVLLHAALTAGVQRYIQQSIVQIYPDGGSHWLDESTPLDLAPERAMICGPIIKMEEIVRANAPEQLQWCILRGGYFVGPGTLQDYQIALLRAERCTIPGDGSEHLSLINVRDMATAITAALAAAPAGSTFNIVDEPVYHSDYIDHIADLLKVPHARRDTRQPRPPSHRCNNKAAREALGWRPVYGIWPTAEQITTQ